MQLRPYRDVTLSRSVFPPILPRFEADVIGLALLPPAREGSAIVIIVADDAQISGLLMRVLQGSGYRTIQAQDLDQALKCSETSRVNLDLLLVDTNPLRMEMVRRICEQQPNLKVLYLYADEDERAASKLPPAWQHFENPSRLRR